MWAAAHGRDAPPLGLAPWARAQRRERRSPRAPPPHYPASRGETCVLRRRRCGCPLRAPAACARRPALPPVAPRAARPLAPGPPLRRQAQHSVLLVLFVWGAPQPLANEGGQYLHLSRVCRFFCRGPSASRNRALLLATKRALACPMRTQHNARPCNKAVSTVLARMRMCAVS
ncbi:MAG: hypothetical protein J3K34DRAFT_255294 [Monoraphidium minutum]|nr:MAG: hypothetical protein J3K34DRAFT_255294 [Monoraphidium minutum]